MPVFLIIFILLVFLTPAIVLTGIGWRGRKIDDHPCCRRCGFDLTEKPADSNNCPECGTDLRTANAIRIGHFKRRARPLTVGILLLLLIVTVIGMVGIEAASEIDWLRYEPVWWLLRETDSGDPNSRQIALGELSRRMTANELSASNIDTLTTRALAIQADPSKPWIPIWGDFVESAHTANSLPPEKWAQYARQAVSIQFVARAIVRRGDPMPANVVIPAARVGIKGLLWQRVGATDDGTDLAKPEPKDQSISTDMLSSGGLSSTGHEIALDPKLLATATDGMKTARVCVTVDVFDTRGQSFDEKSPPLVHQVLHLQAPWKLVAADVPTVQIINDETLRPAVTTSLVVKNIRVTRGYNGETFAEVEIEYTRPPRPLAYEVILRDAKREWPIGSIYCAAGAVGSYETGGSVSGLTAAKVDVVLRPSLRTAVRTVDVTSFWNGEVVLKDIPVKYPTPTTKP